MLIIMTIVSSLALMGFKLYTTGDIRHALRVGLTVLTVGTLWSLPIGVWETEDYAGDGALNCPGYYVVPSDYSIEDYSSTYRITPVYTSLIASCFDEREILIAYSTEAYTRKEAIEAYLEQTR